MGRYAFLDFDVTFAKFQLEQPLALRTPFYCCYVHDLRTQQTRQETGKIVDRALQILRSHREHFLDRRLLFIVTTCGVHVIFNCHEDCCGESLRAFVSTPDQLASAQSRRDASAWVPPTE